MLIGGLHKRNPPSQPKFLPYTFHRMKKQSAWTVFSRSLVMKMLIYIKEKLAVFKLYQILCLSLMMLVYKRNVYEICRFSKTFLKYLPAFFIFV